MKVCDLKIICLFKLIITNLLGQIGTTRFCSSRDLGDKCDYIKRKGDDRYHRSCVFTCSSYACNKGSQLLKTNNLIMALVLTLIIRINA